MGSAVVERLTGHGHSVIEVDITDRLDLAKKFNVLQTPTTLVLNQNGRVTSRIGGAPKQSTIDQELGSFVI